MLKRTINFEIVKTPKDAEALEPRPLRTPEEIMHIQAIYLANAENVGKGLLALYAAKKAIDTISRVIILKAGG